MRYPTAPVGRWTALFLLMLTLAVAGECLHGQEIKTREPTASDGKLEWQYSAGREFKMKMDQQIEISMSQGANKMPGSTTHSVTEMTTRIESVDDEGVATASGTIDRMMVSTSAGGIKMSFDSASNEEPAGMSAEIARMLAPMVGKAMTQKMMPSGRVFDVQVPEEMMDGVKSANPMMASMFSKQTIEEISTKGSLDFPSPNPAVGEKWEVVVEVQNGPAPVTTKNNYEYLGVTDLDGQPLHVIKVDIGMSFPNGIGGMDVDITREASHGYFYFDGVGGMLKKSSVDQDVTMQINAGDTPLIQVLKQKLTMDITAGTRE